MSSSTESDPEAARAAELVASWAGIANGRREELAAQWLIKYATDYSYNDKPNMQQAFKFADDIIRFSRENPPKE